MRSWLPTKTAISCSERSSRGMKFVRTQRGQALYRLHGSARASVSTMRSEADLRSRVRVLEKVTAELEKRGQLDEYSEALGIAYHTVAARGFRSNRELARECVRRAKRLAGHKAITGRWLSRILCRLVGLERKELIAGTLARLGVVRRDRP